MSVISDEEIRDITENIEPENIEEEKKENESKSQEISKKSNLTLGYMLVIGAVIAILIIAYLSFIKHKKKKIVHVGLNSSWK